MNSLNTIATVSATVPPEPVLPVTVVSAKPARLDSLQVFRGVAALLVVLHHAGTFSVGHFGAPFFGNALDWGASGVDFFFVLSGFIIYFIHRNDLDRPDRLRAFVLKRLIRVYPIYWLACAVVIPLYFLAPTTGPGYARNPLAIVTSVLLIPQDHFPVLGQAWTLTFEMLFYGVFALLILRFRVFIWPAAVWMGACMAIYLYELGLRFAGLGDGHTSLLFPWNWLFSRHNVLFGAGVGTAILVLREGGVRFPRIFLWTGVGLFLLFAACNQPGSPCDFAKILDYPLTFGLASTLVVIGAAGLDLAGRTPRIPLTLLYIGNASYSIYLFHSLAMSLAVRPLERLVLTHRLGVNVATLLLSIIAVGIGCAVHTLVERRLLSYLRLRLSVRGA